MPLPAIGYGLYLAGSFALRYAATTAVRYAPAALNALRVGATEAAGFVATRAAPAAAQAATTVGRVAVENAPAIAKGTATAAWTATKFPFKHPLMALAGFGVANHATDGAIGEAVVGAAVSTGGAVAEHAPGVAGVALQAGQYVAGAAADGWSRLGSTVVRRGVDGVVDHIPPGVVPAPIRAAMQGATGANKPKPEGQAAGSPPASAADAPAGAGGARTEGAGADTEQDNDGPSFMDILTGNVDPRKAAAMNKALAGLKDTMQGNSFAFAMAAFGMLGGGKSMKERAFSAALWGGLALVADKMLGGAISRMLGGAVESTLGAMGIQFNGAAGGQDLQRRPAAAPAAPAPGMLPAPAPM